MSTDASASTTSVCPASAASVPVTELMWLVAAEQDCCQFFRFSITVDTRGVALKSERRRMRNRSLSRCSARPCERQADVNSKRENATILGVGAVACAACCAGPILGFSTAIGLGTAAGFALFGTSCLSSASRSPCW